jgi:hypothetical protein
MLLTIRMATIIFHLWEYPINQKPKPKDIKTEGHNKMIIPKRCLTTIRLNIKLKCARILSLLVLANLAQSVVSLMVDKS